MTEQTTVKVVIRGAEFSFRTDDPEYIRKLAEFVNGEIEKIATSDKITEPAKAITLAAFNIADELFRLREQSSEMSEDVSRRIGAIIERADEVYRSTETPAENG